MTEDDGSAITIQSIDLQHLNTICDSDGVQIQTIQTRSKYCKPYKPWHNVPPTHLSDATNEEEEAPTEARGFCQGGDTGRDAEVAIRQLQERAQLDASTSTHADAAEWFNFESESLVSWATDSGWLIDPYRFKLLTAHLRVLEGGLEHQVMFQRESGRVLKVTKPPNFGARGNLVDYVNNVIWCNVLFGDDIRLEGVLKTSEGTSLVVSQPFILGKSPTLKQIKSWFQEQGYSDDGFNKWKNANGTVIADTHPGNFIRMKNQVLIPIDLQVLKLGNVPIPSTGQT